MAVKKDYLYPRVDITTRALKHSSVMPAPEDTTILFAPLITPKGPSQVVTPLHSIAELTSTFGSLSYEKNGQMALNVYNWLDNGGTVYLYRMAGFKVEDKLGVLYYDYATAEASELTSDALAEYAIGNARNFGGFYNDLEVQIKFLNNPFTTNVASEQRRVRCRSC